MKDAALNIAFSFFGGRRFAGGRCAGCIVFMHIYFFLMILAFFEVFFFIDASRDALLIACGVLIIVVTLIKIIMYILKVLISYSVEESTSNDVGEKVVRPDNIPDDVWQIRHRLINPSPNMESVVSDLLATGVDEAALMALIDYLGNDEQVERLDMEVDHNYKATSFVYACGRVCSLCYDKRSLECMFPANHTLLFILFAAIFGYSASYLPLSLRDELLDREKGWLAVVLAINVYSILTPPSVDPYSSKVDDCWTGLCRSVGISLIATLWRECLRMKSKYTVVPLFGCVINWDAVNVYLVEFWRYGLLLFPFWVLYGLFGHPISQLMSILEAFNRYAFGQCGISSFLHWLIQFLRGTVSVVVSWALLDHSDEAPRRGDIATLWNHVQVDNAHDPTLLQ